MQRRTTWDQSISSGLTSSRVARARCEPSVAATGFALGAPPRPWAPASPGWRLRRGGLAGATSPIVVQHNVPAHCIGGYTHDFVAWFPGGNCSGRIGAACCITGANVTFRDEVHLTWGG